MFDLSVTDTNLSGVFQIQYSTFNDDRGRIFSPSQTGLARLLGMPIDFSHDKVCCSSASVLRGIHGDQKSWKLVCCLSGQIQQIVVDCRPESPTFCRHEEFIINSQLDEKPRAILIPPRCGNAFLTLSDHSVYMYKLAYDGSYADADEQFSYRWDSSALDIDWKIDNPIISERDRSACELIK